MTLSIVFFFRVHGAPVDQALFRANLLGNDFSKRQLEDSASGLPTSSTDERTFVWRMFRGNLTLLATDASSGSTIRDIFQSRRRLHGRCDHRSTGFGGFRRVRSSRPFPRIQRNNFETPEANLQTVLKFSALIYRIIPSNKMSIVIESWLHRCGILSATPVDPGFADPTVMH